MSNKFNPGNMINPSWLPYSTFSSVFHNKAKRAQQGNLLDQPFCNQITFIRQHVQHDQPRQHDHDGSQLHELHSTLYLSHYPRPQPHRGHRSNISKIDHKDMRLKIVKRQICKKKIFVSAGSVCSTLGVAVVWLSRLSSNPIQPSNWKRQVNTWSSTGPWVLSNEYLSIIQYNMHLVFLAFFTSWGWCPWYSAGLSCWTHQSGLSGPSLL